MKRTFKNFLCFVLALSLCTTIPATVPASAATYSVSKAIAYAQAHWNDGVGLCAEFVSQCVIAGGINMPVKYDTTNCFEAAQRATGLDGHELRLNSSGYATRELNADILQAGDIVIQECKTHYTNPHIMFCGGYSSRGYATFYAHNGAANNKEQILNVNTAYEHTTSCDMRAFVLHLSCLSTDENGSGTDNSVPISVFANNVLNITETNATVYGSCSKESGTTVSTCGIYLGTSEDNLSLAAIETPTAGANAKDGGTGFDIWYDLNSELGIYLTPGTTYYFRFYCVVNNVEYLSRTNRFTTTGTVPTQVPTAAPVTTATPVPTAIPVPTATPIPTASPMPNVSPVLTVSPTAAALPTATATPTSTNPYVERPTITATPDTKITPTVSPAATPLPSGNKEDNELSENAKGTIFTVGDGIYMITSETSKTVKFVSECGDHKSFTVPSTVKFNNIQYKVTEIGNSAFAEDTSLITVTIGTNVRKLARNAFSGCSNLKTIVFNGTKVTSIYKNAFKGISSKATFLCPSSKLSTYKKVLTSKTGYKKAMKVKAK